MTAHNPDEFRHRHVGPQPHELPAMLQTIGIASLDQLIDETVPKKIRLKKPLKTGAGETEYEFLARLKAIGAKNKIFKTFIGLGFFDTITPSVILRCVLENPSWYTPYTPYQAEISQGRLEALLNFQTLVKDLAGMDVANASLLDEATAAAEAMAMLHRIHSRSARHDSANVFFVSDKIYPQTLDVLRSRAAPLGVEIKVGQFRSFEFDESIFGALIQNPDADGNVCDIRNFIDRAHSAGVKVAVATDLLACTIITPPGEMGADIAFGSAQRFGVPMGYGGPNAAFFATRNEFVREMPGRIIGVSVDRLGNPAYRMSLQTREQHIRREKAKSNICTAQALLANIAGFYGTYHGPCGLRSIATRVHGLARVLDSAVRSHGARQENPYFFDTVKFILPTVGDSSDGISPIIGKLREAALKAKMNFRYEGNDTVIIALDETTSADDVAEIVGIFATALGKPAPEICVATEAAKIELNYHRDLVRESKFMTHPVFNSHHSETQMMRYLKMLEKRDLGLDVAMIPLGSCTMKLNAATEMIPITWPEFAKLHPFIPSEQAKGWAQIIDELETALAKITGFAAVSLQPNAGSQGEYAGLMTIRAYHASRGEAHRNLCLIPSSAHGTNPASAVMAGFDVVVVACDKDGRVDLADLKAKAEANNNKLAALMVTYPSTYGVFEEGIVEICNIVHANGGQVYMDGANMNAQVGLTSPGHIGADVCHLNLHKTFAIPHGGGGPGMGPIGVAKHLAPFLPGHPVVKTGGEKSIHAVSAAPFGSATVLLISYAYISMLGDAGMTEATKFAILNANYIKARLESHFEVHYVGSQGRVAHEMIFDLRPLKEKSGIDETDVAKRLMDYGFHAPTVSWPVPGTMMIEPTESEPKCELDRFCDAMIAIRGEIQSVINGETDKLDNVLKNAPHTATEICSNGWKHAYPREAAAFPTAATRASKFWPSVARIDNTHGDKNLVCSCPDISNYGEQAATAAV